MPVKEKVAIGLSGGVDSAVAALSLLEKGYDVCGVALLMNDFFDEKDAQDAKKVADALGIEFHSRDIRDLFKKQVIDYFIQEYLNGRTPNPCVKCNPEVKIKELINFADSIGAKYVATGHYANVEYNELKSRYVLKRADSPKDQSYALAMLNQKQLSRIIFPLSKFTKENIREKARLNNLPVADKSDSQDICFIKDESYSEFIEKHANIKPPQGNFISKAGEPLGKHKGITHYTIGQRKGLGMSFGKPMYVTAIDPKTGSVELGDYEDQFSSSLKVINANWIAFDSLERPVRAQVKTRYSSAAFPAQITPGDKNTAFVHFDLPQKSFTRGQAAVFYDGDIVLGGGIID